MIRISLYIILILSIATTLKGQDSLYKHDYFYHPRAYNNWDYQFYAGLSVTRLPVVVVEEEISQSPMLNLGFRLGLPWDLNYTMHFNSNYIANYSNFCLYKSFDFGRHTFAIGGKAAVWFGHLQMDAIRLKSYGWILNPTILYGYDFEKFMFSVELESQHSRMFTSSDDVTLGTIREPAAGFAIRFNIEQPLWSNHCVSASIKLNYAKFYYQSWLSFNTVNEYLFYPEIHFGFIL